jgi:hypothetical protein
MDEERGGMRIIHRQEVDLGLLKGGDEVKVPTETVQLGDQ